MPSILMFEFRVWHLFCTWHQMSYDCFFHCEAKALELKDFTKGLIM